MERERVSVRIRGDWHDGKVLRPSNVADLLWVEAPGVGDHLDVFLVATSEVRPR